jgi:uncharacterized protein (TIGR02145 family)
LRAYATNSAGTAYGNQVSFTTSTVGNSVTINFIVDANDFINSGGVMVNGVVSIAGSFTSRGGGLPDWTPTAGAMTVLESNVFSKTIVFTGASITTDSLEWKYVQGTDWPDGDEGNDWTGVGAIGEGPKECTKQGLTNNRKLLLPVSGVYTVYSKWGECHNILLNNQATLTTSMVVAITATSATSGGIINISPTTVSARGVCWSTSQNPTIALSTKTNNGTGTGSFSSSITGLSPGTTYYVRAYATNSAGTSYGNQQTLTTATSSNIVDVDGNVYTAVSIGTQVWMKENLKVSKYRNGDPIPTNLTNAEWYASTTSGACAVYNNDAANNTTYGKLYNWYAVVDSRNLCPTGWHVPTDAEWTTLENYLGGTSVAGGKLKSTSSLWASPNTGATNESGFSGLPGGNRSGTGTYLNIGNYGYWWSSTGGAVVWCRDLRYSSGTSTRNNLEERRGLSVRCLRD